MPPDQPGIPPDYLGNEIISGGDLQRHGITPGVVDLLDCEAE
jgi:hypothetical protein